MSKGYPLGSNQGGAVSGVSTGRATARAWRPTSGESPIRCPMCGLLADSEDEAQRCCTELGGPAQARDADPSLDGAVVRLFMRGHTPSEIAAKLGVRPAKTNACYTRTREKFKRERGLNTDQLQRWRNKRRKEVGLPALGTENWRKR